MFEIAVREAELGSQNVRLELNERPHESQTAAEFSAAPASGTIRVTWAGVASLWALAQGVSRVARRMFEARRSGKNRLEISEGSALDDGLNFIEFARRLCLHDLPGSGPEW